MIGEQIGTPRLYTDLASWWPLLSSPDEYAEEAATYARLLSNAGDEPALTLLELGSGGGNNASFLKSRFEMTLVDPSAGMLAVSRALNPQLLHVQGDMRDVRLARQFDRVFVHDAICYMTTEQDLRRAMETAFLHCRPGGGALFCPDHVRETFRPSTDCGGYDAGGRGLRYLEWTWDPVTDDTTYTVDYVYLLRGADHRVEAVQDRHVEGLFARAEWLQWLEDTGFQPRAVPIAHSELEDGEYEVFVCEKPRGA